MRSIAHVRTLTLTLVLLSWLPACGGGGGGGTASLPVEYHYGAISATGLGAGALQFTFGAAVQQPDGALSATLAMSENGQAPTTVTQSGRLAVSGDGAAVLTASDVPVLRGFRSEDGAVVVLGTTAETRARPAVVVLVRRAPSLSTADLRGVYLVSEMAFSRPPIDSFACAAGAVSFDAVPSGTLVPTFRNTDGMTTSSRLAEPRWLRPRDVVAGLVDLPSINAARQTAMTHDGEFLWGGSSGVVLTDPFTLGAVTRGMVKTSTAASNATFSGRYGYIHMKDYGRAFSVVRGTLTADGAGGVVMGDAEENVEGTRAPAFEEGLGFSAVNLRGELTMDVAPGLLLQGGISPSGRYAVLAGNVRNGGRPTAWILVRLAGP